jgi:hypothetical protein
MQEDLAALSAHQTSPLPQRKYHAAVVRTGERRVILSVIQKVDGLQPSQRNQKRKDGAGGEDGGRKRQS